MCLVIKKLWHGKNIQIAFLIVQHSEGTVVEYIQFKDDALNVLKENVINMFFCISIRINNQNFITFYKY
jgi:hypothetical protein